MPNYNRVLLMGNLTKDPELKIVGQGGGASVCNFRLAINREWTAKDGEKHKEVCYVSVTAWQKQAENVAKYLMKGSPVFVEGRLQSKNWETDSGEKRQKLEVVADRVQFLPSNKRKSEDGQAEAGEEDQTPAVDAEDDTPF